MTNTCDLEAWIQKRGLTRRRIAELMGISSMSLYRKIHNLSEFRAGEIAAITRILQLSQRDRDRLFFGSTGDLQSRKVTPRRVGSLRRGRLEAREEALPELPGQLTLEGQLAVRELPLNALPPRKSRAGRIEDGPAGMRPRCGPLEETELSGDPPVGAGAPAEEGEHKLV